MKKIISIFCATALLVSLTGCSNGEVSEPSNDSQISAPDSNGTGSSDYNSTNNPDSSDNSKNDSVPEVPGGEPTFLTAPDGTPIYTSEISEIYKGSEERGNKKTITLAEAEQIAQTGDGDFTVKCEGFVYGYIPQKALNRVDNPEMFEDGGNGESFDYLGELSEGKAGYNKRLTDFIRIKPGDKFGELTVKTAYTLFTGNTKYANTPYVPGAHISDSCIEFDGIIELEGYIYVTPTDTLYGEGGDMTFLPNGDSSTKLPCVTPFWDKEDRKYYAVTHPHFCGYFGDWHLKLGNMYKVDCDTSGLHPGDSMVKAKISLENIKYVPGNLGGIKVELKSIEII